MEAVREVSHLFSWHALGRWYERSGLSDDANLIYAMASALQIDPAEHELGADLSVAGWRGSIVQREKNGHSLKLWASRTWIEDPAD
jgi:hypothetical protein